MKRRVTERALVLILSIAVLLSSTGISTVFATQVNTAGSTTVTDSSTVADESPEVVADTQKNIVEAGGAIELPSLDGIGTVENPYRIASADDLLLMQQIINDSTKADKYFTLVADIDLSDITVADLKANTVTPGTLISVNKTLSDATPKSVWFNLNGRNHRIFGLDVASADLEEIAIFGYISKNSRIKNVTFENCNVTLNNEKATAASVIALSNEGTINNLTVKNSSVNLKKASADAVAGIVATTNAGNIKAVTVDNVKVNAACAVNSVGAVAGVNNSLILSVKASGVSVATSQAAKSAVAGGIAGINNSRIKDSAVSLSTVAYAKVAGGVAGVNAGEIINCSANGTYSGKGAVSEGNATLISDGIFGGIAGNNNGKILSSTASDMGAFMSENGIYGGIAAVAGKNSVIDGCVATGAVSGKGIAGGIAGKAEEGSSVKNSYTFVSLNADTARGAVIGEGKAVVENNFWSSEISGRYVAYKSGEEQGDMIRPTRLITINAGESKKISLSAFGGAWCSAAVTAESIDSVKLAGSGVEISKGDNEFTLKATAANKTATITFNAKFTVNAGCNNVTVVNREMPVSVITLEEDAQGNGLSAETPVIIDNANELEFIKAAPFAFFELAGDVELPENWKPVAFSGQLNGAGFSVAADTPVFSAVYGSVKNLTVKLNGEIKTAVFGDANSAEFDNVRVIKGEVEEGSEEIIRLLAEKSGVAVFLNKVMGNTVINRSYAEIPVYVADKEIKNIAGFVAVVDATNANITSSGAKTEITSASEDKISESAAFIGKVVNNADGTINGCFATLKSDVVDYALIGSGNKETFKAENNYISSTADKACPGELENVVSSVWMFDAGEQGFIAGKGSVVSITLPAGVALFDKVSPADFEAVYDAEKLSVNTAGITVKDGVLYLPVEAAENVVTVLNSQVTLIHKPTGLQATIGVSNGLEQDADGNYIIYYAVDIAFIGDNLDKFGGESFVLANDIDMSKLADFRPVGGTEFAFSGKFNGCGYTISGLTVNGTAKSALFATLENATVTDLVIDGAEISATGSYAGVLAGQIRSNTTVKNITVTNSKITANESFAGAIAGSVNGENIKITGVEINNVEINAMNYAGGVIGNAEGSIKLSSSEVSAVKVTANNYVGGVAGCSNELTIDAVKVNDSTVTADNYSGGIAGIFAGEIKSAKVNASTVEGSVAGGIIGATVSSADAVITNSEASDIKVNTIDGATAAGGFAGVVVSGSKLTLSDVKVAENVEIGSSMASGGFIGDIQGDANISNSTSCAVVNGCQASTKLSVGAGGIIGKISAEDVAAVSVKNVNVGGKVTGYDYVGGAVGNILSSKAGAVAFENCVIGADVNAINAENSALIIGCADSEVINKSVKGIVISTYATSLGAYSSDVCGDTYTDLDKFVNDSLEGAVTSTDEITVSVSNNKAAELGFVFDSASGWKSESSERISVISSNENQVVIVANKPVECAIVANYILSADSNISLRVHFNVVSDIKVKLNGSGTQDDPYRISDGFELDAVRDYMGEGVYFVLTNNIRFTGEDFAFGGSFYNKGRGFAPIGTKEDPFTGVFDGNGYSISGLYVNADEASLFGAVKNAEIKNVNVNIKATGLTLAAGIAARTVDTDITDVTVSGSVTVTSENGSAAGVVAFAQSSALKNVKVDNITVSTPEIISANGVVYSAGIVARAIDTSVKEIATGSKTVINSAAYAGGVIGYGENAEVESAQLNATVSGEYAGGIFANISSQVKANSVVVDGVVEGKAACAGIAGVANGAIKAWYTVISADLNGEVSGVVAGFADESIYTAENKKVSFIGIIYSSYQNNGSLFGEAELDSYQVSDGANAFVDVNSMSPADGDKVAVGKDALDVSDAVKLLFKAQGNAAEFSLSGADFILSDVTSYPEGLVKFDGKAVTASKTQLDGAKLILTYSNGIKTAVNMLSVVEMTGNGTAEEPYVISNEDTMKLLGVYPSAHFVLSNNITLTEARTPVPGFSGKLDGNGFTVSALSVKAENAGLFEVLTDSALVSDITFDSAVIDGSVNAGVVCANINGDAKISNVTVSASTVKGGENAGAIAGMANSSSVSISGCSVSGCTVEGENAAGVVAVAQGGGLEITGCSAGADVSGKNAASVVAVAESDLTVTDNIIGGTVRGEYSESGLIAVVSNSLQGDMLVSGNEISAQLSGEAENSASVVGVFEALPEDNEAFAKMFNNNTVKNGVASYQREVMQYQNFSDTEIQPEVEIILKGEGTKESPYEIYTAEDLGSIPDGSDAYFVLMNNIEITAADYGISADESGNNVYGALYGGYSPIKDFSGSFDGNGFVISGLYINTESDYAGLFANIKANGQVKNVHVEILDKAQGFGFSGISGKAFVGGIAGYCESVAGIVNCSVEGGTITGERAVGAIVGELASSKLAGCVAVTTLKAENTAGGLVGVTKGNNTIENCVSATTLDAQGGTVVGVNEGRLSIYDILSTGSSNGSNSITVGANNGEISIEKAVIGGTNTGAVSNATDADSVKYVYSDVTTLGTDDKKVTSLSAGKLLSAVPEGLEGWVSAEGHYPAPAMADDYASALVLLASIPVMADIKEGKDVVNGFAYPVTIGSQGISITVSTLSGEDDLYLDGNKVYNNIFSGEMPYAVISDGRFDRVIVLPQKNVENVLYISTAEQLKALAKPEGKYEVFNKYLNNEKAQLILTADINFNASALNEDNTVTPIIGYTGDFNGNGYTISNLRITNAKGETGLFATIGGVDGDVAMFKDITFNNVYITGCGEVGALAGSANEYTAIENVRVEGDKASYVSGMTVGAIVGNIAGGTVNEAYADITVEGNNAVGGLFGSTSAVITHSNSNGSVNAAITDSALAGVGGFAGVMNGGTVYTSSALADVTVTSVANATDENALAGIGGFVGVAKGEEIKECFSAGSVKVSGADSSDGKAVIGIGGFAGVEYCDIETVYSSSAVTADFTGAAEEDSVRAIGGLVGVAYGDVNDAYASGGVSATLNSARIFGSDCFAGGVIGYALGEKYENLYFDKYMNNDANLTAVSNVISDSCYRLTTDELMAGEELSSYFSFSEGAYPYIKSMFKNANAESRLNSVLSVIATVPSANDESLKAGEGASKSVALPENITLATETFDIEWIAGESAVIDGRLAALNRTKPYADYMSLTAVVDGVSVSYERLYADVGTVEETIGNTAIEYTMINESGDDYMNSALVGLLIKSRLSDNTVVTSDIFTTCDSQAVRVNKLLVTSGGFYIDSSLPSGYDIKVTAKDGAGNEIKVTDAGAQGVFVETANAGSVVFEITIVEKDIPWGLTSLWESLVR